MHFEVLAMPVSEGVEFFDMARYRDSMKALNFHQAKKKLKFLCIFRSNLFEIS